MNIEITMQSPPNCRACNWKPEKPENGEPRTVRDKWINVLIPGSVASLFICPKCGFLHPNDNVIENIEKMNRSQLGRIITPGKPKVMLPDNVIKGDFGGKQ